MEMGRFGDFSVAAAHPIDKPIRMETSDNKNASFFVPWFTGRLRVVALMGADALCLFAAWAIAVLGYDVIFGLEGYSPFHYFHLWPLIPCYLALNAVLRLYQGNWSYPSIPLDPVEELRRLCASTIFSHLLLMSFLGFSRQNTEYSRVVILCSGTFAALFSQAFRNVVRSLIHRFRCFRIPVALSGEGEIAERIERTLTTNPYLGLEVVLRFDYAHLREVVPACQKEGVTILLACQDERLFRAQARHFSSWFTHIEYLPRTDAFPVFGGRAVSLDGIGGLEMVNQSRMKMRRAQKAFLDYFLATIALILSSPLFILIPLLIKVTSAGPVFYRAERLGKNGRPFKIWKFRSMYADAQTRLASLLENDAELAEEYKSNFKLHHDPRVTPLGRFLRRTSLDELPQLLNVFAGEMALVGPRPIVQDEVHYYGDEYKTICRVLPGITGLWQCSGRSDTDYARRVELDVHYVLNWSPWMDLWICLRTVGTVLGMKGAC